MNRIVAPVPLPGGVDGAKRDHLVLAGLWHPAPELLGRFSSWRKAVEFWLVVGARNFDGVL